MCIYVCVWGCLDKYISVATWPPKQKFLAPPLAAYTHFRIPAAKPVSAGDHSPPSTACSSLSISCSQSGAVKTLFSASLGTCIAKTP